MGEISERRVINALLIYWRLLHKSQPDLITPSITLLELIEGCSSGVVFFRQVYLDLRSGRSSKYADLSESEFKQFLETQYRNPTQISEEHQAQEYERIARADFEALGMKMAKTTTHKELVELGWQRAKLAQYTGRRFLYESHCWNCPAPISSAIHAQCPLCTYYICSSCGACLCGRIVKEPFLRRHHDQYRQGLAFEEEPFLPDFPDDAS